METKENERGVRFLVDYDPRAYKYLVVPVGDIDQEPVSAHDSAEAATAAAEALNARLA